MRRPNPVALVLFLVAVLVLFGGAVVLKGGLYLSKHEGDTLHLLDILFRMEAGERIHQDFMTPIGVLAFAPILALLRLGLGAGHALIWAQVLVAALVLPLVWWTVRSRLAGFTAWLTGFYMMLLALALTYGEAEASLSMSMHYNRWAWVLAYAAVLLALLPNLDGPRPKLDGALVGLSMAGLALLKATYFVALAPAILVLFLLRRDRAGLAAALAMGLAVAALVTLWCGFGFWPAYIGDLLAVMASENRPQPGLPLASLLGSPPFLGITFILLASIIQLRRSGKMDEGLALLLLAPGLVYATYQNFGNDPQWLLLLVAILMMLRPGPEMRTAQGWSRREMAHLTVAAALAFAAPSFLNLAYSVYRHAAIDTAKYAPLLPALPRHADLQASIVRSETVNAMIGLDGQGATYARFRPRAERPSLAEIDGQELPDCEIQSGIGAWYGTLAEDLASAGFAGQPIFEADLFNVLYLYGDFPRLEGAAPWYYSGTPGIADAAYVLVPDCPISAPSRKLKLEALAKAGIGLREVHRTGFYRLYKPEK